MLKTFDALLRNNLHGFVQLCASSSDHLKGLMLFTNLHFSSTI